MEPVEYLRILRRRWPLILGVALFGAFAGFLTAPTGEDRDPVESFRATHTLVVNPDVVGIPGDKTLQQLALLVTVGEVPERAAARMGWEGDPILLATEVAAAADPELKTVTVESTQPDGARAAAVANAFAESLVAFLEDEARDTYQRSVEATGERLQDLQGRVLDLDGDLAAGRGNAEVVRAQRDALVRQYGFVYEQYQQLASQGTPPGSLLTLQRATPIPIRQGGFQAPDSRSARGVLGGVLGLVLGVGVVLLLHRLDTRVRTKEDAEEVFGAPVLVEVPALARHRRNRHAVLSMTDPRSAAAEVHRVLRTSLLFANTSHTGGLERLRPSPGPEAILVTSCYGSEGKTTTVVNLAAAFAQAGRKVLVVGADVRRPAIHRFLEIELSPGIADLLAARGPGSPITADDLRRVAVTTAIPGVMAVPSGDPTAEVLVSVSLEKEVVEAARELADVVIIDSSPLLLANDTAELVPAVDAVLVVCRSGAVSREAGARAAERLRRLRAPLAGVVLVAPPRQPGSGADAYRYYGYAHDGAPRSAVAARWRGAVRRRLETIGNGTSAYPHEELDEPDEWRRAT